jgi:Spy/CpxP family protein refolding chaperone
LDNKKDGELGMKYMFSKLALAMGVAFCGASFASASIAQTAEFNLDEPAAIGEMQPVAFAPSDEMLISAPVVPGGVVTVATDDDTAAGVGEGPKGPGHHHSVLSTLSYDQLEKLHNLHNQFLDEAGPKFVELGSKTRKLHDVLLANNVDAGAARALQSDINRIKDELASLKLDNKIAMSNVLTAEQKTEIREHVYRAGIARMYHHGGEMHHHHGGPGGHGH